MSNYSHYKVGCDAHKYYSLFSVLDHYGQLIQRTRVNHEPGAIRTFLTQIPHRTGRLPAPPGPRRQGQVHDGPRPQDR